MTLWADDFVLHLTPVELELVMRPIKNKGGAQGLLRKIHARLIDARVSLDYVLLDQTYQYAYVYGPGGYEDRFRAIVAAGLRAGWEPTDPKTPGRHNPGRGRSWNGE